MELDGSREKPWFLKSTWPVLLPSHEAFTLSDDDFVSRIKADLETRHRPKAQVDSPEAEDDATTVLVSTPPESPAVSTTADIREHIESLAVDSKDDHHKSPEVESHPFMRGLTTFGQNPPQPDMTNKMFTENADVAHRSTGSSLVDIFYELEETISGPRLNELLNAAWREDPLATLKIIFNARSIHLGKSSRHVFYRCAGWLATNHPLTLICNLRWLSRPVIQKKVEKNDAEKEADDVVLLDAQEAKAGGDSTRYDVRNGVAHGYWKDLVTILVLAVTGKLNVYSNPRDVLNITRDDNMDMVKAHSRGNLKEQQHKLRDKRHKTVVTAFEEDPVYRALHIAVARLFAEQLRKDIAALKGDDKKAERNISLCAKWAPTHKNFHDKHTFVISSIAEVLYPMTNFQDLLAADTSLAEGQKRELYLRHAREAYRKDCSALRAHLDVVERHIGPGRFGAIQYERVPSVAMNNYTPLFARKDPGRFEAYIDQVAGGKARISGATLLPSTLVAAARAPGGGDDDDDGDKAAAASGLHGTNTKQMVGRKLERLRARALDGQWRALVQRVRDSGALGSSIAVCDVSGSMLQPRFGDGTCPLDAAIGLSLLLAEAAAPPFAGAFVTFSARPTVERVALGEGLRAKVRALRRAPWGMSTDLVAVFERLLLPMALANGLRQEDMVRRVFVFSDMQFDAAGGGGGGGGEGPDRWSSSYERVAGLFAAAGYRMPQLVFWNLAGGRAGYGRGSGGDPVAPKPVTTDEVGTALVSGYSQGMLKVFLENGSFEAGEAEEEVVDKEAEGDDGDLVEVQKRKKAKMDPLSIVKKAIGHKAYDMLCVED